MAKPLSIGQMRERLTIQRNDPPTIGVVSLTRTSTTATVTTTAPHGYLATDYATIAGCDGTTTGYNAKWKLTAVPTPTSFTFTCSSAFPSPATGAITVTYTSNSAGGQGANGAAWRDLDTVWAEMIPISANERLQLAAIQSDVSYRFRIRVRSDLLPTMRARWTPSWINGEPEKTLAIAGILPVDDGRTYSWVECSEVGA